MTAERRALLRLALIAFVLGFLLMGPGLGLVRFVAVAWRHGGV